MSGQYGLTKEQQDKILSILKEANISCEPYCRDECDDGKFRPFHRDVFIKVSSYDDESEEFDMYVEVD